MNTCKNCEHYKHPLFHANLTAVSLDKAEYKYGSCGNISTTELDGSLRSEITNANTLLEDNSRISSEFENHIVGESFGCIHFEQKA